MLPENAPEDDELMRLVAAGEIDQVEELFERHHASLYRFLHRLSGQRESAEDLLQETFLRVVKYRRSFRPGRSFRAWLFSIARAAAASHYRHTARWPRAAMGGSPEAPDASPIPSDRFETREQLVTLREALDSLSKEDRETLLLARFEGLSHAELAQALGCTVGAARVRVHRALTRLRHEYRKRTEGPGHAMQRVD